MTLLLDTHVWFWYVVGDETLKKPTRNIINSAAQNSTLHIAAITLWEISTLDAKKRVIFEMPCLEWIKKATHLTHTQVTPISAAIAVESCNLPDGFHDDPADRMIVATARVEGMTLLTRDARILSYGRKKYISTIKV